MTLYAVGSAGLAALVRPVFDNVLLNQQRLAFTAWAIVAVYLLKGIGSYVSSYLMADVGHQIGRHVRTDALQQIHRDDGPGREGEALLVEEHVVEDRPDESGQSGRPDGVQRHPRDGGNQPPAVGPRVAKEAPQRVRHSVNRYFRSVHTASMPSFQVIFLPSS